MQTMYYFAFGLPGRTESIIILIGLVLWVGLSALVGLLAWHNDRSPIAWVLLSILVSPLIVFLVLTIAGRRSEDA